MAQAKKPQPTRYLVHLALLDTSVAKAIQAFELNVSVVRARDPNLKLYSKTQSRVPYVVVEAKKGLKEALEKLPGVIEVVTLSAHA